MPYNMTSVHPAYRTGPVVGNTSSTVATSLILTGQQGSSVRTNANRPEYAYMNKNFTNHYYPISDHALAACVKGNQPPLIPEHRVKKRAPDMRTVRPNAPFPSSEYDLQMRMADHCDLRRSYKIKEHMVDVHRTNWSEADKEDAQTLERWGWAPRSGIDKRVDAIRAEKSRLRTEANSKSPKWPIEETVYPRVKDETEHCCLYRVVHKIYLFIGRSCSCIAD